MIQWKYLNELGNTSVNYKSNRSNCKLWADFTLKFSFFQSTNFEMNGILQLIIVANLLRTIVRCAQGEEDAIKL